MLVAQPRGARRVADLVGRCSGAVAIGVALSLWIGFMMLEVGEKDGSKNCLKGTVYRMVPECEEQRSQPKRGGRRAAFQEGASRGASRKQESACRWPSGSVAWR